MTELNKIEIRVISSRSHSIENMNYFTFLSLNILS